ncbi:hypothetical protein ABFS82_03G019400 [Erythranthe guttata]
MKNSLRIVVLMLLVLLGRGDNENKVKICSQKIFMKGAGSVCSIELCIPLCQMALPRAVDLRGDCIARDTCNCTFRC